MLFISQRRLRRLRPCHTNTEFSTGALSPRRRTKCTVSVNTSFCKGCSRIVRPDFHWVKDRPTVVLLPARCGRTVL